MEGPVIEVSHLSAAASFYGSVCQPLGISYLCFAPSRFHFGFQGSQGPKVVFTLQQSAVFPPRRSRVTLLAHSPAAVSAFYKLSLQAHPPSSILPQDHSLVKDEEDIKAQTRDLDGNMLEAVYSTGRRRRLSEPQVATTKEAKRVLDWQQDVARSVGVGRSPPSSIISSPSVIRSSRPPVTYRHTDSYPSPVSMARSQVSTDTGRPLRLVRRETTTTERYRRDDEERHRGGGISGLKLAGGLITAAAGAAVAYALVTDHKPEHTTPSRKPHPPRRATYDSPGNTYNPVVERIPARSSRTYVPEPQYVAQIMPPPLVRGEERSMASVRTGRTGKVGVRDRERSRSETGSRYEYERPLTIRTRSPSSSGKGGRGGGSAVSHRSHKSSEHRSDRSSPSHHGSGRKADRDSGELYGEIKERDRVQYITTRLPDERRSHVGGSVLGSVVGGYAGSVAPSDSVSSVGMKRERERLRDRMRERERERW